MTLISSIVGESVTVAAGATLVHCWLQSAWSIGEGAYLHGVGDNNATEGMTAPGKDGAPRRIVRPRIAVHEHRVPLNPSSLHDKADGGTSHHPAWTVFGVDDDLSRMPHGDADADGCLGRYCNAPWADFFVRTGIDPAELWPPGTLTFTCTSNLCI